MTTPVGFKREVDQATGKEVSGVKERRFWTNRTDAMALKSCFSPTL
jgi:hypothetical protein